MLDSFLSVARPLANSVKTSRPTFKMYRSVGAIKKIDKTHGDFLTF